MNIPMVPTDSLYKFMALAGVLLVLVGVFYPTYLLQRLQPRAIDAQNTAAVLKLQTDQLNSDIGHLKVSKLPDPKQLAETERKIMAVRIKLARARGEDQKVEFFLSQAKIITTLAFVISIFGLFLASSGFSLWYIRIQKQADELAMRRLREIET